MHRLSLLSTAALALLFAAYAPMASAFDATSSVSVKVNLTSRCQVRGTTVPVVDFGTYPAFSAADVAATPTTVTFECTRGFGAAPTVAWDVGTDATADGLGVIAGLQYTLSAAPGTRAAGSAATTASIGTADTVPFTLSGTMPKLQAGEGAGGAATAVTRTLTVTF